jgi:hypothetical protein
VRLGPLNGGGDAIGIEDDNTDGPGKWKLPSSQTVDGRAFVSGDLITLEADFDADTITFWRSKGGVGGSPEVGNQGGCNNYGHYAALLPHYCHHYRLPPSSTSHFLTMYGARRCLAGLCRVLRPVSAAYYV